MSDLVERLREQTEQRRLAAGDTYRALLAKDTLTAADEGKLLDCLQILGRSIDMVADDAELLARAEALKTQVLAGATGLAQERGFRAAIHDAEVAHAQAVARANADLERRRKEIGVEFSGRGDAITARTAEHTLSSLRGQLADAFGSSEPWHIRIGD